MGDLWMFDFAPRAWTQIPQHLEGWTNDPGRDGAAMTLWIEPVSDAPDNLWLYVFGGDHTHSNGPVQYNDVHRALLTDVFDADIEPFPVDDDEDDTQDRETQLIVAAIIGWLLAGLVCLCIIVATAYIGIM